MREPSPSARRTRDRNVRFSCPSSRLPFVFHRRARTTTLPGRPDGLTATQRGLAGEQRAFGSGPLRPGSGGERRPSRRTTRSPPEVCRTWSCSIASLLRQTSSGSRLNEPAGTQSGAVQLGGVTPTLKGSLPRSCWMGALSESGDLFRINGQPLGERVERPLLNALHLVLLDARDGLGGHIRLEILAPKTTLLAKATE